MKKYLNDAVKMLCKYIQIDTSHPNPNYDPAFDLFSGMAKNDGLEFFNIDLPSNKRVMTILQRGLNPTLPAIALNHHIDVVAPQKSGHGRHDSFCGVIENDYIYGRGAQDMKSVGVIHYQALRALLDIYGKPQRSVYLIIVPDEEIGGFSGVGQLVNLTEFKNLNIKYVVDEGIPSGDEKKLLIKVGERKVLQVKIECYGQQAHGSELFAKNPIHSIINFLSVVPKFQLDQQKISGQEAPGLYLSTNITSICGGILVDDVVSVNTVPPTASATIDIRIPHNINIDAVKNKIFNYATKFENTKITILAESCEVEYSSLNSEFYNSIKSSIIECGFLPQNHFCEGSSDLRFYLKNNIEGFGLSPFTITPNAHGIDEAIRIRDLEIGINVFLNFLKKFCF